jgi:hypothetical protein
VDSLLLVLSVVRWPDRISQSGPPETIGEKGRIAFTCRLLATLLIITLQVSFLVAVKMMVLEMECVYPSLPERVGFVV